MALVVVASHQANGAQQYLQQFCAVFPEICVELIDAIEAEIFQAENNGNVTAVLNEIKPTAGDPNDEMMAPFPELALSKHAANDVHQLVEWPTKTTNNKEKVAPKRS